MAQLTSKASHGKSQVEFFHQAKRMGFFHRLFNGNQKIQKIKMYELQVTSKHAWLTPTHLGWIDGAS